MPAQAGTQSIAKSVINARWVPACAGMTKSEQFGFSDDVAASVTIVGLCSFELR